MRAWEGRVLTGSRGAELLARLVVKAEAQALARAEEASGRIFGVYQPWMSHSEKRAYWPHLQRAGDAPLVPTAAELRERALAFVESDGPLRAIDPSNTDREVCFDQEDAIARFRERVPRLHAEVAAVSADFERRLGALVREVIPLRKIDPKRPVRFDGEGMTTQFYRGGVFLTLAHESAHDHAEDLLNYIHECGHQAFNLVLCSDDVIAGDLRTPSYSPVRKTFRPGILAVHALVAVAYMLELMARAPDLFSAHNDSAHLRERYAGLIRDLEYGLAAAKGLPLTEIGRLIVEEFEGLHAFALRGNLYA